MKTHTTNYQNTLIEIADDSPNLAGTVPPVKGDQKTVALLQFEQVVDHPYAFTSDEVLFAVYARRQGLSPGELEAAREAFFSKGQPCFRSSPLTKQYGWGVHSDAEGRIALLAADSEAYARLAADPAVKKVKAMRSKRG